MVRDFRPQSTGEPSDTGKQSRAVDIRTKNRKKSINCPQKSLGQLDALKRRRPVRIKRRRPDCVIGPARPDLVVAEQALRAVRAIRRAPVGAGSPRAAPSTARPLTA